MARGSTWAVLLLLLAGVLVSCQQQDGRSNLLLPEPGTRSWRRLLHAGQRATSQQLPLLQLPTLLQRQHWWQPHLRRLQLVRRRLGEASKPATSAFQQKWTQVFPQQWQAHNDALRHVRVGNASLAELAAPLLLHNVTLLNPAQLKRAVTHMGNAHRLKRVLQDLRQGRRVKLAVIGGSISWGSAVERGVEDWFALVLSHLRAAFPAANVTGRNGCVPATPSSFMNHCLEEFLDEDVDLVFLEFTVNDGYESSIVKRRTYERLLRKVLAKPRAPAVVQVHLPTVGMAYHSQHREKSPFHRTVEDVYGAFAAYYDVPSVSMRNAVWKLAELHHFQLNWTEYYSDRYDFIHPLEAGHRAIADMVLFALQQAFVDLLLHPWNNWDEQEVAAPLPTPMYNDNWEEVNLLCRYGKAFETVVDEKESKGWQLVNEGNEYKPKFGFVSRLVGAELVLTINTTRAESPATRDRINVQLAYLRSYSDMGIALVRCGGGCDCPPSVVNGHHSLRQSTVFLMRLFPKTTGPVCRISVVVQQATDSGGHKFKVTGVSVNEAPHNLDDTAHEELNQEKWLGAILKGEGELVERWSKAARRRRQHQSNHSSGSTIISSSSSSSSTISSSSSSSSSAIALPATAAGRGGADDNR